MKFPTEENKIAQLAMSMFNGFWHYPADFPNINRLSFLFAVRAYQITREARLATLSFLKTATKEKKEKLDFLRKVMRDCLKKSIVDTKDNPEKLLLIGWGPKVDCRPQMLPNQPVDLQVSIKENAVLFLSWKKGGGRNKVRNYIIERRQQTNDSFSKWVVAANSYRTKITLTGQPKLILLEYRVTAANSAGKSIPSNTVNIII